MRTRISTVLSKSITLLTRRHVTTEAARTTKLERIAEDLLKLNRIELHDYSILFTHKLGLNRYGSATISSPISSVSGKTETKTAEKTAFDLKLEKFDPTVKLKVIKEVRSLIPGLGLKEAKELVEKVPVVIKQGLSKEEANIIMEKLKAIGAIVALE